MLNLTEHEIKSYEVKTTLAVILSNVVWNMLINVKIITFFGISTFMRMKNFTLI